MSVGYDVRIKQSAWKQALEIYTNTKNVMEQEKINQMYATGRIMQGMEGNAAFSMFHSMDHTMNRGLYQVGLERVVRMKKMLEESTPQISSLLVQCEGFIDQLGDDSYVTPSGSIENGGNDILAANYSKLTEIRSLCDDISSDAYSLRCSLYNIMDDVLSNCKEIESDVLLSKYKVSTAYTKLNRVMNYKVALGFYQSGIQALEEDVNVILNSISWFTTEEPITEERKYTETSLDETLLRNLFENDSRFSNWSESDIDNMIHYLQTKEMDLLTALNMAKQNNSSEYEDLKEILLTLCLNQIRVNELLQNMIEIAWNEVGEREEKSTNYVKYNTWFYNREVYNGDGIRADGKPTEYAWCSVFVLWCMDQAGLLNESATSSDESELQDVFVLPDAKKCYNYGMAGVAKVKEWYRNKGLYHDTEKGDYTPRNGDFVCFHGSQGNHIGIVIGYDEENQLLYTIEGNTSDQVLFMVTEMEDPYIVGFCENKGTETDIPDFVNLDEYKPKPRNGAGTR